MRCSILISKLRERSFSTASSRRYQSNVAVQLDYYMSPQFGGLAAAVANGLYDGLNVSFLPICPVGLEQERIRHYQNDNPAATCLGSVEQNIFVPTLHANASLKVKAVAATFHQSPLCIASLAEKDEEAMKIGAHEDTVELLQRIFPQSTVIASPRASKITDLTDGRLDGIQAYTTTEVPTLRRQLGSDPVVVPLEGRNGTKLGYSQMLFASDESLEDDRRAVVSAFLEATFQGWQMVIDNPEEGIEMVRAAQKMLGLDDEGNDHWFDDSIDYQVEMLRECNAFVEGTANKDGKLGVIDPARWNEATNWLLNNPNAAKEFGLDSSIW